MIWESHGCPTTLPRSTFDILNALDDLYSQPDCELGGPLHSWVEDDIGGFTKAPDWKIYGAHFTPEAVQAAQHVVDLLLPLPDAQQGAAVALYHLYWPPPPLGHALDCCTDAQPGEWWHFHADRVSWPVGTMWNDTCRACAERLLAAAPGHLHGTAARTRACIKAAQEGRPCQEPYPSEYEPGTERIHPVPTAPAWMLTERGTRYLSACAFQKGDGWQPDFIAWAQDYMSTSGSGNIPSNVGGM
jgi:hypothetical protein